MLQPSLTRLLIGALFILCTSPVFSQISPIANLVHTQFEDDPEITTIAPFTILHQKNEQALKVAPNAQFLTLNHALLGEICQNKPHNITLKLPYQGGTLLIDLTQKDITTDDSSDSWSKLSASVHSLAKAEIPSSCATWIHRSPGRIWSWI